MGVSLSGSQPVKQESPTAEQSTGSQARGLALKSGLDMAFDETTNIVLEERWDTVVDESWDFVVDESWDIIVDEF